MGAKKNRKRVVQNFNIFLPKGRNLPVSLLYENLPSIFERSGSCLASEAERARMSFGAREATWSKRRHVGPSSPISMQSTIKNDRQLVTMVEERYSLSQADADNDV